MARHFSFDSLIDKIIDVYAALSGKKATSNYVTRSIKFLKNLKEQNFNTLNSSSEEISCFFRLLLDASGIIGATEGSLDSFDMGDLDHVGRKKDIHMFLSGGDEQISDWMCSTLFQGYARQQKPTLTISKDLRYVLTTKEKVCDFVIEGDGILPTLIECKRIHPQTSDKSCSAIMPNVILKIIGKISEAKAQFESTEKLMKKGNFHRLVILDMSAYGDKTSSDTGDLKIVGLIKKSHIIPTIRELEKERIDGIDEVTICWSNRYYFEEAPRVLAYYTVPLFFGQEKKNRVNYGGWTIEFYPLGGKSYEFRELRISAIARSPAWIRASWYSSKDRLITFGPEERLERTRN